MLKKKLKIDNKERVEYILKKGLKINWRFGQIRYLKNRHSFPRFCVIVSGKISKKAVERNFIRRRIYEAIRTGFLPQGCYDIVVLVSRKIINALYRDIKSNMIICLQKLGCPDARFARSGH